MKTLGKDIYSKEKGHKEYIVTVADEDEAETMNHPKAAEYQ